MTIISHNTTVQEQDGHGLHINAVKYTSQAGHPAPYTHNLSGLTSVVTPGLQFTQNIPSSSHSTSSDARHRSSLIAFTQFTVLH